ncbi:MAG: T9SS type A sorting domain-containing protein [Bacteroidia bacterium]
MKRFLLIIFQLSMLSVKAQTAYNLKNISVFNPSNTLIDFVKIDNQLYALLGYRPNDTSSGFKLYKANSNYDIEDSLIVIENKLQTYITNAVVNNDKTITIAISKHHENELQPTIFLVLQIDKNLNILNRQSVNYNNFGKDIFTYANIISLKNNTVLLNLIFNKNYTEYERCYNVYIKCNLLNGTEAIYVDTTEINHNLYKLFASFNQYYFKDEIIITKFPNNLTLNYGLNSGLIIKRFDTNLNLKINSYVKFPPHFTFTFGNCFHTIFDKNNNLYVFAMIKRSDYNRFNPNIIQITPKDSMILITNLDSMRNQYIYHRSVISNNAIVMDKSNHRIYGVTTYLTNNYLNWFGIISYDENFNIISNRYYKFKDSTEVYIRGMIRHDKELIVYGWQNSYNDKIYRPLFLTITNDGWLTGENDVVVRTDLDATIYPNPANQQFTIQTNASVQSVHITDMQGKLIKTVGSNIDLNEIDIADLPPGMYIVQLQTPNGILTKKLVVE